MSCIRRASRVGATRPALNDFADCKAALLVVLRDDHEGLPLRVA